MAGGRGGGKLKFWLFSTISLHQIVEWEGGGKVVGGGGGGGAVSKVNALSRVPYRTARPLQQQKFVYTDSVANS
jgi:hypothetical protein